MTATSTKLRPDDLVRAVALLTPAELSEFVLRFDEWRFGQAAPMDSKAAQIAEARRLPAIQRVRVADLLTKNREEGLSNAEEAELDSYLEEMDRRLVQVADQLTMLSKRARP